MIPNPPRAQTRDGAQLPAAVDPHPECKQLHADRNPLGQTGSDTRSHFHRRSVIQTTMNADGVILLRPLRDLRIRFGKGGEFLQS